MYKVFIENKPIVFIHANDLLTEESSVEVDQKPMDALLILNSEELKSLNGIEELLKDVEISNPLYLTSKNPMKEFNRLFKDYKYIEAAGGIVQREESYLVIKRKGFWDIPKGMIDKGESPETACVREISEECGIKGQAITGELVNTYHVMKWDRKDALKKTYWFMLSYTGSDAVFPQLEEDITEVVWMNKEELLSIRNNTFGSINEVLDAFVRNDELEVRN